MSSQQQLALEQQLAEFQIERDRQKSTHNRGDSKKIASEQLSRRCAVPRAPVIVELLECVIQLLNQRCAQSIQRL